MSSKKVLKKHWFYRSGNQKRWKTIGFTSRATENVEKPVVLLLKPAPGNGATVRTTDPGSGFAILGWMSYEEPLQPSCLGKKRFWYFLEINSQEKESLGKLIERCASMRCTWKNVYHPKLRVFEGVERQKPPKKILDSQAGSDPL